MSLKFGEIGASLLPSWEAVGPTLKEFIFGRPAPVRPGEFPEGTFLNYEDMIKNCVALRTFGIENIGFGTVPVSKIIAFGDRLRMLLMMGSRKLSRPRQTEHDIRNVPEIDGRGVRGIKQDGDIACHKLPVENSENEL